MHWNNVGERAFPVNQGTWGLGQQVGRFLAYEGILGDYWQIRKQVPFYYKSKKNRSVKVWAASVGANFGLSFHYELGLFLHGSGDGIDQLLPTFRQLLET